MGRFTKPIKNLDDLFVHTLQDVYYAENQITQALPQMIVDDAAVLDVALASSAQAVSITKSAAMAR